MGIREESHRPSAATVHFDKDETEEDDEDEDDWDAFQSFPASANAAGADSNVESTIEEPDQVEDSFVSKMDIGNDSFQENSASQTSNDIGKICVTDEESGEGEVVYDSQGDLMPVERNTAYDRTEVEEPCDSQTDGGVTEQFDDNQIYEREFSREEGDGSRQLTEQIPSDLHSVEEAEGSAEVNLDKGHEPRNESTDTKIEPLLLVTDPLPLDEEGVNSKGEIQFNKADKDSQESMAEKESDEQQHIESSNESKSPISE